MYYTVLQTTEDDEEDSWASHNGSNKNGDQCNMKSFKFCIAHQYYLDDQLKEDDMGGGWDLYKEEWWRGEKQRVVVRKPERDHMEDLGKYGRIILQ